jgi:hypothetical protein
MAGSPRLMPLSFNPACFRKTSSRAQNGFVAGPHAKAAAEVHFAAARACQTIRVKISK